MRPFKKGDVVWLKSGGPKMTIKSTSKLDICTCIWFQFGEIQSFEFEFELLTLSDPFSNSDEFSEPLQVSHSENF